MEGFRQAVGTTDPEVFNKRISQKIEHANNYLKRMGYEVNQVNGQRISKPINWDESFEVQDEKCRCEVFVGSLERDLFEDELLPVFEQCGRVIKIRLMMDFSRTNRGFAYIKYETPQQAQIAVDSLHKKKLKSYSKPIVVFLSIDNRRLYVGKLPMNVTKDEILDQLRNYIDHIMPTDVEMPYCGPHFKHRYVFIVFPNHKAATLARRVLVPNQVTMFNRIVDIDWAKPPNTNHSKPSISSQSTNKLTGANYSKLLTPQTNSCQTSYTPSLLSAPFTSPVAQDNSFTESAINSSSSSTQKCWASWNILGLRAAEMMEAPVPTPIGTQLSTLMQRHDLTNNSQLQFCSGKRSVTISNLDLQDRKTKHHSNVFSLAGHLKINSYIPMDNSAIRITYQSADEAKFIAEAICFLPQVFSRLALPGHQLKAQRGF